MIKTEINLTITEPFKKWSTEKKRIKIAYGGRGGGKSENIAILLIAKSFSIEGSILCARETQTSIEHSVYSLLKDIIRKNSMSSFFKITKNEIINKMTKSNFIFSGLLEYNITSIKSIYNIKICWIEEGENVSDESYTILEPSIRGHDSEIWVSFNPRRSTDVFYNIVKNYNLKEKSYEKEGKVYKYGEISDENILITNVCFYSNPYFTDVLEKSRQLTLKNKQNLYAHIWLGEIKKEEGRIFLQHKLKTYDYNKMFFELSSLLIKAAVDPAFGEKSCFSCVIIYVQKGGYIYLLDSGLIRADANRTSDEGIEDFLFQNKVQHVLCEANFSQNELVKKLRRRFDVTPFYVRDNKIERIVNASIKIYERVYFPNSWFNFDGNISSIDTKEARGYLALRQLLNFSDIGSENCVKGNESTYLDFPDCLSSLVMRAKNYSEDDKEERESAIEKIEKIFFEEE